MSRKLRMAAILVGVVLLSVMAAATPVMAKAPDKNTVVAPVTGGPDDGVVKSGREGKLVPDKSNKPPFGGTTYEDALNQEPGTFDPGTVFWGEDDVPMD